MPVPKKASVTPISKKDSAASPVSALPADLAAAPNGTTGTPAVIAADIAAVYAAEGQNVFGLLRITK
jgi:hypothetical protein